MLHLFDNMKHMYYYIRSFIAIDSEVEWNLPALELHYFDTAGLAECIRLTLKYFNYKFVDTRYTKEDFETIKELLPFKQLPQLSVFENDDEVANIVQSKAILRYVGKLTKTYPTKIALNAAFVDEWVELHTEFMFPLVLDMYPDRFGIFWSDDEKKKHREWCIVDHIPKYFRYLEDDLNVGPYLGEMQSPSIADFSWLATIQWLTSGIFTGSDLSIIDNFPNIQSYKNVLENLFIENDDDTNNEAVEVDTIDDDDSDKESESDQIESDEKKIL